MKQSYIDRKLNQGAFVLTLSIWLMGLFAGFALSQPGSSFFLVVISVLLLIPFYFAGKGLMWRVIGVGGEFKTKVILEQMWNDHVRAVHNVKLPGSKGNIDHIAISPYGVFVIETKFWDGEFYEEHGRLHKRGGVVVGDPIGYAFAQTMTLKKLLSAEGRSYYLTPIVALVGRYAKVRFGDKTIKTVHVVGSLGLRKIILNQAAPSRLSKQEIDDLVKLLKKYQE